MKPALRKTLAVLPLVAACAAFGPKVQAQTLNISGKVQNITCTATLPGGNTVHLPIAQPSDFPSVGSTIHRTNFSINLSACGSDANGLIVRAMFYNSTPGAVTNNRLNLDAASTGSGWQYQFRARNGSAVFVRTGPNIVVQSSDAGETITSGAANMLYRVEYYRSGTISTGTGTASVNYVLYYI